MPKIDCSEASATKEFLRQNQKRREICCLSNLAKAVPQEGLTEVLDIFHL
jgi:hypothetical protein